MTERRAVSIRLQGAGLDRAFVARCARRARDSRLTGSITPQADGLSAELTVEGMSYQIEDFRNWLSGAGDESTVIRRIDLEPAAVEESQDFLILT